MYQSSKMKKHLTALLLLFLPLLFTACNKDDDADILEEVTDAALGSNYKAKALTCSCGTKYIVYLQKDAEAIEDDGGDYIFIGFRGGISIRWRLTKAEGDSETFFPMSIGYRNGAEGCCRWTCDCSRQHTVYRTDMK